MTNAVQHFFRSNFMPRSINFSYVSLIPKAPSAWSMKDYRLIVCCSVLYKIISKVLTNITQHGSSNLVGDNQFAFIKRRVIFDNIIMSHKIIKSYKRKHISPRCMLKVDSHKAYDSVEWPFIKHLMLRYLAFLISLLNGLRLILPHSLILSMTMVKWLYLLMGKRAYARWSHITLPFCLVYGELKQVSYVFEHKQRL